jgi:predicted DNA-binding transcriptional regulator YafY
MRLHDRFTAGGRAERVVDPYGLVCKAGVWYLVADADGEGRLFRVSRVKSAQVSDAVVTQYG